ncbi:MAG: helix-turn-helix domain-containing protein [Chloroflexota bacterium]|nr:helix-turn-helix domain-containing protein [Chloroflexota bacterium]
MTERSWLTVVEAAKLMGVSEKTMRRAVQRGRVPHVRLTGQRGAIRIPRRALVGTAEGGDQSAG